MSKTTPNHGSYKSYTAGFISSIVLTVIAFYLVDRGVFAGWDLAVALAILATGQLLVQLICFLHIGKEDRPRWNLTAFLFMLLVVGIVVIGSLWIMYNLDYNMSHTNDVDSHIMEEENIYIDHQSH